MSAQIKDHECPDEIHTKEVAFNPSSQGPYGQGYFGECETCDNTYEVTKDTHDGYILYREAFGYYCLLKAQINKDRQAIIDKLKASTRVHR